LSVRTDFRRIRTAACAASLLAMPALSLAPMPSSAQCQGLDLLAELRVTGPGVRPVVTARVNGIEAQFLVDSGAFFSSMSSATAARLNLKEIPAPLEFVVTGIGGGTAGMSITVVDEFKLAGVPFHHLQFMVGGSEEPNGLAGWIGQNVLRFADIEYDLHGGVIRLMRPREGCRDASLAYWAGSQPYSVIELDRPQSDFPPTRSAALVNGARVRVRFDTGADLSMLDLEAARRAGVEPGGAGVAEAGYLHGIGEKPVKSWIAPIASFKLGDEEIRKTRIRIGDLGLPHDDMLIGADFFQSHRVYVANSQHKLYFTYNGGPVFDLKAGKEKPAPKEPAPQTPQ
jgi:predicted aspartyl protease